MDLLADKWVFVAAGLVATGVIILISVWFHARHKTVKTDKKGPAKPKTREELAKNYEELEKQDVFHIFSKEFHEELRNKARLDFQKVINENAMFLQQDLRMTTSEINEYLKKEVSGKLQEEFMAYQQSIRDVQQAAVKSINDTVMAAQQQQAALSEQIKQDLLAREEKAITDFEQNMAEVVSHYVVKTVGQQMDLKEQMPYILREMETQKEAMKKDMWL